MKEPVILCVEDSDAFAHAIRLALMESRLGVHLVRVSDGDEALHFLRREHPHENAPRPALIFLDLNLPRRSGFDILAEMQRDAGLRKIPAVILTSSNHPADRARSLELGAQDYLLKPTEFEHLLSAMTQTCRRYIQ
jgi:two-component system, chemotaxis family, response regulator Rcp1